MEFRSKLASMEKSMEVNRIYFHGSKNTLGSFRESFRLKSAFGH